MADYQRSGKAKITFSIIQEFLLHLHGLLPERKKQRFCLPPLLPCHHIHVLNPFTLANSLLSVYLIYPVVCFAISMITKTFLYVIMSACIVCRCCYSEGSRRCQEQHAVGRLWLCARKRTFFSSPEECKFHLKNACKFSEMKFCAISKIA